MKPTVLNVIIGVNTVLLALIFISGYAGHDGMTVMVGPFILSAADLGFGLVCVVALVVLSFINKAWRDIADKMMQGFMIAFGLTLVIAVPACFAGMGMR